jgi:hypothetical protein
MQASSAEVRGFGAPPRFTIGRNSVRLTLSIRKDRARPWRSTRDTLLSFAALRSFLLAFLVPRDGAPEWIRKVRSGSPSFAVYSRLIREAARRSISEALETCAG